VLVDEDRNDELLALATNRTSSWSRCSSSSAAPQQCGDGAVQQHGPRESRAGLIGPQKLGRAEQREPYDERRTVGASSVVTRHEVAPRVVRHADREQHRKELGVRQRPPEHGQTGRRQQ